MNFKDQQFKLNSPEMTKIMQDVYMPTLAEETWNNSGALSEAFGLMNIGKKVNAPTGKLDVYVKKGKHGAVGAFADDYTFDRASQKPLGDEMVVRTRGFQANARIDIVPNRRMEAGGLENIFANQFEELGMALKKNYSRMLYGNGSGEITKTTTAIASGSEAVKGFVDITVEDVRPFEIGDIISFAGAVAAGALGGTNQAGKTTYDTGAETETSKNRWATHGIDPTTVSEDAFMIVDIDEIGKVITLGQEDMGKEFTSTNKGPITTAKLSIFYRRSVNQDMHGLGYIMSNGGYFGLGETVYGRGDNERPKYMRPYIANGSESNLGAASKFLTEYDFQKAIDMQELRGADLTMNMVVTSRGTRASIASTNQGASTGIVRLMRDAGATAANDQRSMGYQGVDIKGESVEVDRFAPQGDVNFLDLSGFNFALEQDLTLDNFDGQTWKQVMRTGAATDNKASRVLAYEANMYAYKNFFNHKPRTLAQIKLGVPAYIKADKTVVDTAVDYL